MWEILEHRRVENQAKALPTEILKRYEKWKDVAMISGPAGLRLIRGFHDEALKWEWKGLRSSRLGLQYRVIYKLVADKQRYPVEQITRMTTGDERHEGLPSGKAAR